MGVLEHEDDVQPDAADLREVAEEAGDLGDPGPLVDGEQGLRWQPAAGQARDLAQCRQRLGEDARDERAAVAAVRRAGDVEDGGLAPDRCEVDLASQSMRLTSSSQKDMR